MDFSKHMIKIFNKITGNRINPLVHQGLKIGKGVFIGSDVLFDPSFPWLISIDDDCTITSRVIILAHDASTKKHIGYTKIGRVSIGKKTFVGMGSIILPGVSIGDNVIIGAGSIVTKDIPNNTIVAGNPATIIGATSDFIRFHQKNLDLRPIFSDGWTLESGITEENKIIMYEKLSDGIGYDI